MLNANDISVHAGSHYACSTKQHIVSELCMAMWASHEMILRHGNA